MRSILNPPVAGFRSFTRATAGATAKAALLLFSIAVLFEGGARAVFGQAPLDGFDPNANGAIRAVVVQPDGRILIGGDFTTLAPNGGAVVTRNHIARLNVDGTLDTAFNPNADDSILSIAVQADGKILAGGEFINIGGQLRHGIARLDASSGLADSFDPNANGVVFSIAVQADGKIVVGGFFSGANSIGGQARNRIARLDATSGLADSFNPNASALVRAIAVQADGRILAGGDFTNLGGQTRNRLARLDPATGLADSFDPNANGLVRAIAVQADGKILAGGDFTNLGGQTRNRIARLDATSGSADSFDPNANAMVNAIAVQADGRILAGGLFDAIGGQTRIGIARLNATNGLADSFDPNVNGVVNAIAVQADGKILAAGPFTALAPNGGPQVTRNRIARLEIDGRLDQTLDINVLGRYVRAIAVQPDGKILIGGFFGKILGVTRNNIARLNTDGTLDMAFDPNANDLINDADGPVNAIAVQPDGKILVGGAFTAVGGQTRNRIARLDPTTGAADMSFNPNASGDVLAIAVQANGEILAAGSFTTIGGQLRNRIARLDSGSGLADSFNPNANDVVRSIAVQTDGKILVGGDFNGANSIGGQPRNRIARLDAMTGFADSFNPNANSGVYAIAVQADGKILAGGNFGSIGGQTRSCLARLDAITGLADSFNPAANSTVNSIAVQADGKVLAGGFFSGENSIGGQKRNRIARLDATTGLADSFNPNANDQVLSIALQADGKILIGGDFQFTTIGGQPRNRFARLSNDTAAVQNLAVTQSNISWTLGGSGPQFTRVTFEYSTDNVNYILLGNGTAAGSIWSLGGLSLSTGVNSYVRARGYYRSGYENGSESLTTSVRNAFLGGPTPSPSPSPTPSPSPSTTQVQFSAASYSAAEGAGFVDITVTRTGDTSGTVGVDYATTDASAQQRTDYTIGAGSVFFLPGEVSKTFAVLIVDDLYVEGSETLNLTLSNPTGGAQLNSPSLATLMITDNDSSSPTTNPDDQARFFVQQHFYDFLSRYPDQSGWDFWTAQITQCGADPICLRNKRIDVSNAFFYELEYQQTGAYVFRLYRAAFGNNQPFPNPDNSNQTEAKKLPAFTVFASDRARVVGGASLAIGQQSIANAFVLRAEFLARYPAIQDGPTFVDAVLNNIKTDAGVDLTAQRTALISLFNSGGRGAVLYRLADDNTTGNPVNNRTFIDAEYNRAFVATQYFGYLRRDADIGGFLFWLGQVNSAPLRDTTKQHAMVCAFITAAEYQQRFSSVVTHTNSECVP